MEKHEISEWSVSHPRWPEVVAFFDENQSGLPEVIDGYYQRDSRVLVAHDDATIMGILRLIMVPIGPKDNLPAVKVDGRELLQARVKNFLCYRNFDADGSVRICKTPQ